MESSVKKQATIHPMEITRLAKFLISKICLIVTLRKLLHRVSTPKMSSKTTHPYKNKTTIRAFHVPITLIDRTCIQIKRNQKKLTLKVTGLFGIHVEYLYLLVIPPSLIICRTTFSPVVRDYINIRILDAHLSNIFENNKNLPMTLNRL